MSATLNQPAVIDLGTGLTKAGFAGSPQPSALLGSVVARTTLPRVMPPTLPAPGGATGSSTGGPIVGEAIGALSGVVRVTRPLSRGVVTNTADAAALLSHVVDDLLSLAPRQHPLLLTENACNPRKNREQLAELCFETLQVPSLYVAVPAVLALYAAGRTTGVAVDVGDSMMTAVPVAHGHAAASAITRVDLGGSDVSDRLAAMLRGNGACLFASSSEKDAVRRIKERACEVARVPREAEEAALKNALEERSYELPDGNIVDVGVERYRAPELLFNPGLLGLEYPGLHECVHKAIMGADMAVRKDLYGSVLLAGGASKTRGLAQRLVDELRPLPPPKTKIRVLAPRDRLISAFTGGTVLSSLSTFRNMTFSSSDYYEQGESIVHRSL